MTLDHTSIAFLSCDCLRTWWRAPARLQPVAECANRNEIRCTSGKGSRDMVCLWPDVDGRCAQI